jgi:hypothetical protein
MKYGYFKMENFKYISSLFWVKETYKIQKYLRGNIKLIFNESWGKFTALGASSWKNENEYGRHPTVVYNNKQNNKFEESKEDSFEEGME